MTNDPDDFIHLGFRVSGRPSRQHDRVCDDFELLGAARDCARILHAKGWADIRLYARGRRTCRSRRPSIEIEIDWRETAA